MFKLSNTLKTRAHKTALLSTVILTLSFGSAFAVPNNSNQDNPFDDPQNQNTPFDGTAFVDFKDEVIVIPCLLIKGFNPGADGSFYRVKMHPQHNLKASSIDWTIVAATPAPECKKQGDNPFDVVNDQSHDPEGKPQDNLPPENNPPVNHQPNDQGKVHQDKPNQGKPGQERPNKPKPEQPANNDPAVQ